jgi:riboflavin synthase
MFTGIVECLGIVKRIEKEGGNLHFTVESSISDQLKVDQSLAHNGVCLTVVGLSDDRSSHTVTAIQETLEKSHLGTLAVGDFVNLERAMKLGDRLDGHMVQGHVDQTAVCTRVSEANGSWVFGFRFEDTANNLTIEKGSITVNGVSLTVVNSGVNTFEVAIIPYTYQHTNFKSIREGSLVNLEFDVLGKYVSKLLMAKRL